MQGVKRPFINIDDYVRKHLEILHTHRNNNGFIRSKRGKMGGEHFPNAQNAYFKDHGYERVAHPNLNEKLTYVEVEGPTIEVKHTKLIYPTNDDSRMFYELSPIYNGKPFRVDQADNRTEYFLLRKLVTAARNSQSRKVNQGGKVKQATTALRNHDSRTRALRNGPHPRSASLNRTFKSQKVSHRSVRQR